jgi:hypothetical protein
VYGLTDPNVAHSQVTTQGHIGHEKLASDRYLRSRNALIFLGKVVSSIPRDLAFNEVVLPIPSLGLWQMAVLIDYDSTIVHEISRRIDASGNQCRLPLLEKLIGMYVSTSLPSASRSEADTAYALFRDYYFNRYPDSSLESRFKERIVRLDRDSSLKLRHAN